MSVGKAFWGLEGGEVSVGVGGVQNGSGKDEMGWDGMGGG